MFLGRKGKVGIPAGCCYWDIRAHIMSERLTTLLHSRTNESFSADVVESGGAMSCCSSTSSHLRLEASTSDSLKNIKMRGRIFMLLFPRPLALQDIYSNMRARKDSDFLAKMGSKLVNSRELRARMQLPKNAASQGRIPAILLSETRKLYCDFSGKFVTSGNLQVVGRQQLDLPPIKLSEVGQKEEEEECVTTPTSPESKIPEILTCPPPPKKQKKHFVPSCKRRLTNELHFFQIVPKHEIDHFFKSTYEFINTNSSKKRRVHAELSVIVVL
ncbi:cyclin-dependent protein kinase inhibitor SMR1-like protein [Tanacetum coccineum]